jgi:hypothetical protein
MVFFRGSIPHAALRIELTFVSSTRLMAYRVADACDHAEHTAKPEIGRSDSSALTPAHAFSLRESPQAFCAACGTSHRVSD